ncbi:MAG: hypothetical protein D6748_14100 [Calditrichaeota bacterium]|nr:MAG: hypothetical protein D6748_14100 [Calditrichota bacterium]
MKEIVERYILLLCFSIGIGVSLTLPCVSQSALIEVQSRVDKSEITIGDRITYSLIIDHQQGVRIKTPGEGTHLGEFEIKDYQIHPPEVKGDHLIRRFDFVITSYDTGTFEIPPFPIGFLPTDTSSHYQFIMSEAITIRVNSVVNNPDAVLKDIKPPFFPGMNVWQWVLWGVVAVLIIATIVFLFWYLRKKKTGEPIFKKEVIRPAHEIALEELELLLKSDLLSRKQYKAFYESLSGILRRYLENRFYLPAMEETTTEILDSLREVDISEQDLLLTKAILELSDMVKFAKYIPEPEETTKAIEHTRTVIESTRQRLYIPEESVSVETGTTMTQKPQVSSDGKPQTESQQNLTSNNGNG